MESEKSQLDIVKEVLLSDEFMDKFSEKWAELSIPKMNPDVEAMIDHFMPEEITMYPFGRTKKKETLDEKSGWFRGGKKRAK